MTSSKATHTLNRVYNIALASITCDLEPETSQALLEAICHTIERELAMNNPVLERMNEAA